MIQTQGILLRKTPIKEYDEHLVFFTKHFGKIDIYSFGSRSPKSARRQLLAMRDFLVIECQQIRGCYQLKQLTILKKNDFLANKLAYNLFFSMLKIINAFSNRFMDVEVYNFIFFVSTPDFFNDAGAGQTIIIHLSLLKCLGEYPYFSECAECGKTCSESYRYDLASRQYWGLNCSNNNNNNILLNQDDIIFLNQFYLSFKVNETFFFQALKKLNQISLQNSQKVEKLVNLTSHLICTYH